MVSLITKHGRTILVILLIKSIVLYYTAPVVYSLSCCLESFVIFLIAAIVLLVNNINKYKTVILFEFLFTLSFFFVNYAYPVFIYPTSTSYFSLFLYSFNEDVISRATAAATLGFCSYSIFQYENSIFSSSEIEYKDRFSKVSTIEVIFLFLLLLVYFIQIYSSLTEQLSNSEGAGFFRILAIFLIFKRLYNYNIPHPLIRDIAFWGIIVIYIIVNLLVGNRGDPLYVVMTVFISYTLFVRRISARIFMPVIVVGLLVFFVVGQIRTSANDVGDKGPMISRVKDVQIDENDAGVLLIAKELIINNRSLYVLMDYSDKNGLDYGYSWQLSIYSVIPFLQSVMIELLNISREKAASVNLTTFLEFGRNNPDAFGMGTNLIGDIYICFGPVGIIVFMSLFGRIIRNAYKKTRHSSVFALLYVCFFVFSVYYPRATYLEPIRLVAWSFLLYKLTFRKSHNQKFLIKNIAK